MHHNDMVVEKLAGEGGGGAPTSPARGGQRGKALPLAGLDEAGQQAGRAAGVSSLITLYSSLITSLVITHPRTPWLSVNQPAPSQSFLNSSYWMCCLHLQ